MQKSSKKRKSPKTEKHGKKVRKKSGGEDRERKGDKGDGGGKKRNKNKDSKRNQLFVGGCHPKTKKKDLEAYFSRFGEVEECRLMTDKKSKNFRGFAFITFKDKKSTEKVLNFKKHYILRKKVEIKPAMSKEKTITKLFDEKYRKLFLFKLRKNLKKSEFFNYFKKFGFIEDLRIYFEKVNNNGGYKGYGFVLFKTKKGIDKVLKQGSEHQIGGVGIECRSMLLNEELKQMKQQKMAKAQPGSEVVPEQKKGSNEEKTEKEAKRKKKKKKRKQEKKEQQRKEVEVPKGGKAIPVAEQKLKVEVHNKSGKEMKKKSKGASAVNSKGQKGARKAKLVIKKSNLKNHGGGPGKQFGRVQEESLEFDIRSESMETWKTSIKSSNLNVYQIREKDQNELNQKENEQKSNPIINQSQDQHQKDESRLQAPLGFQAVRKEVNETLTEVRKDLDPQPAGQAPYSEKAVRPHNEAQGTAPNSMVDAQSPDKLNQPYRAEYYDEIIEKLEELSTYPRMTENVLGDGRNSQRMTTAALSLFYEDGDNLHEIFESPHENSKNGSSRGMRIPAMMQRNVMGAKKAPGDENGKKHRTDGFVFGDMVGCVFEALDESDRETGDLLLTRVLIQDKKKGRYTYNVSHEAKNGSGAETLFEENEARRTAIGDVDGFSEIPEEASEFKRSLYTRGNSGGNLEFDLSIKTSVFTHNPLMEPLEGSKAHRGSLELEDGVRPSRKEESGEIRSEGSSGHDSDQSDDLEYNERRQQVTVLDFGI